MTDWRHATTERLWLDVPVAGDVDALHALHADPAVWRHYPSGVHTDRSQSEAMLAQSRLRFSADGLSYWSVRDAVGGPVIGRGGCSVPDDLPWWNLYYRFAPAVHGRGYAVEMGRTALAAAHDVATDRPVLAYLVEHNHSSRRTAEKLGMGLVWRGPDAGNPDPDAVRLVYCDRDPTEALVGTIDELFREG